MNLMIVCLLLVLLAAPQALAQGRGWFVSQFVGSIGGVSGTTDGSGTNTKFNSPTGMFIDQNDLVTVADHLNSRLRQVTAAGEVSIFAGTGPGAAMWINGQRTTAVFGKPAGITKDVSGNFYVSDWSFNNVRKIDTSGIVSTFVGATLPGNLDGTGTSAIMSSPAPLVTDSSGNMYLGQTTGYIRKITPGAVVTTIAGNPSSSLYEGQGTTVKLGFVYGLAIIDADGGLCATDYGYNMVRKIGSDGQVTVIAGSSFGYQDGIGTNARFTGPTNIRIGPDGLYYIVELGNNRIRSLNITTREVRTVLGSTAGNVDGFGTNAKLSGPYDIAFTSVGSMLISEYSGHRIRKAIVMCSPGYIFSSGDCNPCDAGYVKAGYNLLTSCTQCAIGTEPAANQSCVNCGSGYYRPDLTTATCLACPANGVCSPTAFTGCAAGYQMNQAQTACETCPPGFFYDSGNCTACAAGYVKLGYNVLTSCTQCAIGTEQAANQSCVNCGSGYYRPDLTTATCLACPANGVCSTTAFTGCVAGYQMNQAQTACEAVPNAPSPPPSSGDLAEQNESSVSNGGAIAGGVIGGLAFFGLVFVVAVYGQKYIFGLKKDQEDDLEKGKPVDPTVNSTGPSDPSQTNSI